MGISLLEKLIYEVMVLYLFTDNVFNLMKNFLNEKKNILNYFIICRFVNDVFTMSVLVRN